jgi:hypothetical protein
VILALAALSTSAAGSDGINRDVLAHGGPLWSWQVTDRAI